MTNTESKTHRTTILLLSFEMLTITFCWWIGFVTLMLNSPNNVISLHHKTYFITQSDEENVFFFFKPEIVWAIKCLELNWKALTTPYSNLQFVKNPISEFYFDRLSRVTYGNFGKAMTNQ